MITIKRLLGALKSKLVFPSIAVLALVILASFGIYKATQATVVVAEDGKTETIKTHAKTVKDVFEKLDIQVSEHDDLSADLDSPVEDGMEIELIKAKHIMLTVDNQFSSYYSTAETVADFLKEEDVEVTKHDELSHEKAADITEDIHIQLTKAFPITIMDGKEEKTAWTTGGTVKSLLEANDIELKKRDKIKPGLDEQIFEGRDITITRVTYKTKEVEEAIEFETEKVEDDQLEKGKEEVVTEGEKGKLVKTYRIKYENGKKVNRKLKEEKVVKEAVNKVIAVGTKEEEPEPEPEVARAPKPEAKQVTKPAPKQAQELTQLAEEKPKQEPVKEKPAGGKEFTMQATAYTAECNGCTGITATGINLKANPNMKVIAVDPSVIPLGSRVWVEGYGEAIAGDRGGSIVGNRIDVHVPDRATALAFGRKTVKVKILD